MNTKIIQERKTNISQNNSTLYERPVFLAVTGLFSFLIDISLSSFRVSLQNVALHAQEETLAFLARCKDAKVPRAFELTFAKAKVSSWGSVLLYSAN